MHIQDDAFMFVLGIFWRLVFPIFALFSHLKAV